MSIRVLRTSLNCHTIKDFVNAHQCKYCAVRADSLRERLHSRILRSHLPTCRKLNSGNLTTHGARYNVLLSVAKLNDSNGSNAWRFLKKLILLRLNLYLSMQCRIRCDLICIYKITKDLYDLAPHQLLF